MANQIEIPHLNPVNVVDHARELPASYHMRHFDAWTHKEQMGPYEQAPCYYQKWQTNDIVRLQIKSTYDPIRVRLIDIETRIEVPGSQQIMDIVATIDGVNYLQSQFALDNIEPGLYQLQFFDTLGNKQDAEIWDVKEEHEGTLLFKYWNIINNDVLWEFREYMTIRLDGVVKFDKPGSVRTVYIDQPGNASTVKGSTFRKFKLFMGNDRGIPDWQIDKLQEIFDQNYVEIDGKGFSAIDGADFNPKRIERYPYAQWELDVRETNNRRTKIFNSEGYVERKMAQSYSVSLRLFGPTINENNDNSITITEST